MELRKPEDEDIRLFVKWANKPHAVYWFLHPYNWVVEMEHRYDEFSFVKHFIVTEKEKPIGFVQYYDYKKGKENWHGDFDVSNTYRIDYLLKEEEYLHQGYGKKMIGLLEKNQRRKRCL